MEPIYTHEVTRDIVEEFEAVLDKYGIIVPSPEDGERGDDNDAKLYGSTYSELFDTIERIVSDTIAEAKGGAEVVEGWEDLNKNPQNPKIAEFDVNKYYRVERYCLYGYEGESIKNGFECKMIVSHCEYDEVSGLWINNYTDCAYDITEYHK